ncbi:ABC transporter substrate-binding protein [Bradyrhizobium lablabi]|uniref:ABC transporter substrate-binding protein n=1 Tax=Bradyrhizobium lablabi TaxID=722472 RepID=UPI001BADA9F7|nr:ABC transporter substrate-binding protein [Bradyrhizobium lablabi]MBR0696710.1 ABC transporter substrate-binding protein [Bradyrhizobium lablabi]
MRRREFIAFVGAGVMLPLGAGAQQSKKVYRIALLHPSHPVSELTENSRFKYWREFFHALRQVGYIEGNNLVVERFSGEGHIDHYPELAREAAARNPNVIFAITIWMVGPLKEATSTIPIVAMTSDPVQLGLVKSMARPGGNITGVSVDAGLQLWAKRLQLFREVVPTISKLGILGVQKNPEAAVMQETAEKAGIGVVGPSYVDKGNDEEYREVFATMSQSGANALFVDGSPEHITKRQLIGELAAKYRLPAIYPFRSFVEAGGLMSYGIDLVEIFRRAASDIDQILKGANPADIPYYQPTKFELVINLKAAKEIGLTVSDPLLARADEVIE